MGNHVQILGFAMTSFVTLIGLAAAMWSISCFIICCCCEFEAARSVWDAIRAAKGEVSDSLIGAVVVGLLLYAALWWQAHRRRYVRVSKPAYRRSTSCRRHLAYCG